jgi:DNA primase catalytic core
MNDFSRSDLDTLKAQVDLAALMRHAGIDLKPVGKNLTAVCPWHEDKEASLVLNPAKGLYNCFGCEAKGDVLDFLQRQETLSFAAAVTRLRELAGSTLVPHRDEDRPRDPDRLAGGLTRPQLLARVAEHYRNGLVGSRAAQKYLEERGLESPELLEAFGVGYCAGTLLNTVPRTGETRDALIQLGILNDKGKEHFLGCVVVPLEHPELGIVGMYGRRINPKAKVRHLYLPGPKRGVLNWQSLSEAETVYLCEGVLDALSLWAVGTRNVSCLYGTGGVPVDVERFLRASATRELRLSLDADCAGDQATEKMVSELGDRFRLSRVLMPDSQDPNDVLAHEGPGILREFLSCLKPLNELLEQAGGDDGREIPFCETHGTGFTLVFEDVAYEVEPRPPFTGRLMVAIKAQRTDGAGRKFRDRCDLTAARSRAETVRSMSQALTLTRERAETHLMEILDVTEAWVDAGIPKPDKEAAPVLSEAQKLEALHFLQSPDLVRHLQDDMEALGYVGEERGKLLMYLVGVSRKLESPMSAIIRSQSGAGKSGLAGLVAQLVPPEEVVHYSRVSAHALAYAEKTAYKHKLLVMEERVGGEAADYYIRIMQSGHVIRQSVTIKDPVTGKMVAQDVEVEGPIAYIETTTASVLNAENTSRCFEVYLDESEAQTARIHQRQRLAKGTGRLKNADRQRIIERHHNAQRLLEQIPVVIPYVEHLTFPTKWLRTRRDNERFLCLIEASAFLHQYQRPRKTAMTADGAVDYIEANWDDYRLAYELAQSVLKDSLHELSPVAREMFDQISGLEGEFTRREVRELTGWPQTRVVDTLSELEAMEYVSKTAGSNGLTMRYRVIAGGGDHAAPSPLRHILHPDQLRAILDAEAKKKR